jgi:hypothetical protein
MGAVAEFVGDTVGGAFDFVGDVVESVGDIALDAVELVGDAVVSIGEEVGKIAEAAVNDPIGTIAKVAAIATQQYWALPLISAATVVANGGDIGQAALAAGISYVASYAAAGIGDYLGSAGSTIGDMIAEDAASMAAQGLTAGQIAETLASSYQIGADIAINTAAQATLGLTAGEIVGNLGTEFGSQFAGSTFSPATQNLLANVGANTAGGMTRAVLSGGDLSDVLLAGVTSGVGTAAGAGATSGLKDLGASAIVANALGKATGAAASTAVGGGDAQTSFINSLINTSLRETGSQLKSAWNNVNKTISNYDEQAKALNDQYNNKLKPLEAETKEAQDAAKAAYDEYLPVREKFSDLVTQYDAAKAAGNTDLANSLADQANALVPELNAATDRYNGVYNTFQSKLDSYNSTISQFDAEKAKLAELQANYEKQNIALTKETEALAEAAKDIEAMPEPVQEAFAQLYKNGTTVDESLKTAAELKGLSGSAQETFIRNYAANKDTTNSLEFAKQIDGLDINNQYAFDTAIKQGLDDRQALEVAPIISNFSDAQQTAYTNALKQGYGQEGADLISAFAALGESSSSSADSSTRRIAAEYAKLGPNGQNYFDALTKEYDVPPAEALKEVQKAVRGDYEESKGNSIIITGVGQNTSPNPPPPPAPPEITPEEKGFFDKYNSLFAFGTPPVGTGPSAVFGPGASASVNDPLSLFNFGSIGEKEKAIETIDAILADPTATPEDKVAAESVKNKLKGPAGGGGGGGGGSQAETPSTAPTTAPTPSPTPNTGSTVDFGETNPVVESWIANFLQGTGGPKTTPSNTTTTGTTASTTPNASSGTGTGTGGGTGSGTGTGTGSGTGPGTGSGSGGGTGSGTGTGDGSGTGSGTGTGIGITAAAASPFARWGMLQGQDQYGGIKNLTPGLTERTDYSLSGLPTDTDEDTVNPMSDIPKFATGSSTSSNTYDPYSTKDVSGSGISGSLTPGLSKAQINYILTGLPGAPQGRAEGGSIEEHNPSFFSEGGLGSLENRYVQGEGDGTSDSIAAMLANGEFVIPADVVSKLGNGSNEAGASVLDQFLVEIRKHAHSNGEKLPPESKGPLGYLLDAKRKVKA